MRPVALTTGQTQAGLPAYHPIVAANAEHAKTVGGPQILAE